MGIVAPRVGAWIETVSKATIDESHPVWVRGLKHLLINSIYVTKIWLVAPRVGAWIETIKSR